MKKGNIISRILSSAKEIVEPKLTPIELTIKNILLHYLPKEDTQLYHVGSFYAMKTDKFVIELICEFNSSVSAIYRTNESRIDVRFEPAIAKKLIDNFDIETKKRITELADNMDNQIISSLQHLLIDDTTLAPATV